MASPAQQRRGADWIGAGIGRSFAPPRGSRSATSGSRRGGCAHDANEAGPHPRRWWPGCARPWGGGRGGRRPLPDERVPPHTGPRGAPSGSAAPGASETDGGSGNTSSQAWRSQCLTCSADERDAGARTRMSKLGLRAARQSPHSPTTRTIRSSACTNRTHRAATGQHDARFPDTWSTRPSTRLRLIGQGGTAATPAADKLATRCGMHPAGGRPSTPVGSAANTTTPFTTRQTGVSDGDTL